MKLVVPAGKGTFNHAEKLEDFGQPQGLADGKAPSASCRSAPLCLATIHALPAAGEAEQDLGVGPASWAPLPRISSNFSLLLLGGEQQFLNF